MRVWGVNYGLYFKIINFVSRNKKGTLIFDHDGGYNWSTFRMLVALASKVNYEASFEVPLLTTQHWKLFQCKLKHIMFFVHDLPWCDME